MLDDIAAASSSIHINQFGFRPGVVRAPGPFRPITSAIARMCHAGLLDSGVAIYDYPAMLHAKAFVRDGEELLAGTCNLEAWSLKRFLEIDLQVRSHAVAAQFEERCSAPAVALSAPGRRLTGLKERAKAGALAAISPLL